MAYDKFGVLTSTAYPLPTENVDTDQIIPARFLKATERVDFDVNFFRDWRYNQDGTPKVDFPLNKEIYAGSKILVGGRNFGSGSSREHAAMEPRHLGVAAVIVKSFARIHETNLKKQGMLGLTFANEADYDLIQEDDTFNFIDLNEFTPSKPLTLEVVHADGSKDIIIANHTYNEGQIKWYNEGSALNLIKKQNA